MDIKLYQNDLPDDVQFSNLVAIDTEAMGLKNYRDRLCLIQLNFGDGICHLVQFRSRDFSKSPRLKALLEDSTIQKIFHFARFDVGIMQLSFDVRIRNVYCTKIASRLCRTYTSRHGLKDLCKEFLNVDISKNEQTSDWGVKDLSDAQRKYAASDVLYLHQLKEKLDQLLVREGRVEIAQACFDYLPYRATFDAWAGEHNDIFNYQNET